MSKLSMVRGASVWFILIMGLMERTAWMQAVPAARISAKPAAPLSRPLAASRPPLYPPEVQARCEALCSLFSESVAGVQTLELLAENFFLLWNALAAVPKHGQVELTARSQKFPLDAGGDAVSLQAIVQDWALRRFGSFGIEALLAQPDVLVSSFDLAFRSSIYGRVPVAYPACPFAQAGSLGSSQCPLCIQGHADVPPMLKGCVLAYAKRGKAIDSQRMQDYGVYLNAARDNWCLDQAMISQANAWIANASAEVQQEAQGSITGLQMFYDALEGNQFDLTAMPSGPMAAQVARYWVVAFEPAIQAFPGGYLDGVSESNGSCPSFNLGEGAGGSEGP